MAETDRSEPRNLILEAVPPPLSRQVRSLATRVPIESGDTIARAGEPIEHICFPESGVISYSDRLLDGQRMEIGLIGREGFTGWPALLGSDISPHDASVQIGGGTALRFHTRALLDLVEESVELRIALLRFVHTFIAQMGRTIVSNLVDPLSGRVARWILMCHDRCEGDALSLTHKYVAAMLGVRRATVTEALHILEGERAVRCSRAIVAIRDRVKLEEIAGQSYGPAEKEYRRLLDRGFGLHPC